MWCCDTNDSWFSGKEIWIFLILGLWVFKGNWAAAVFIVFILPMIIKSFWHENPNTHEYHKRKNDEDDLFYGELDKPKRQTVYVRTSDGEFIEMPADEYEYV